MFTATTTKPGTCWQGRWNFSIGDRTELCPTGSVAFAPRGTAHSFRNPGPQDARVLIIATPGTLSEIEEAASAAAVGDHAALVEIMKRHHSWLSD
jgi:quercetin dioxygenase-like cupin family protein